jgi:hypothetical protein
MHKIGTWISVCVFLLLGLTSCSSYSFQSETAIKKTLLRDVPIGSSSDTVRAYLRRKTGNEQKYMKNFVTYEGTPIIGVGTPTKEHYYNGAIYCTLSSYGQIFVVYTEVQSRWEFDAKDRLIDLKVTKQPVGL